MTTQKAIQDRILTLLRQVFEKHRDRLRGHRVLLFGSRVEL